MINLSILTGSTRPGRFNIQPATWMYDIAKKHEGVTAELLDLQDLNLPFLDEPMPPMMHQYTKDHTKSWSEKIQKADAFIFVTPEYNHSYSAVLKNAIDYLNHEWNFKPVAFVSYGSLAGGARAAEHLRGVAGELKMYDLREQILLPSFYEHKDDKGNYQFNERHEHAAKAMIEDLKFWGGVMKEARAKMSA